MKRRIVLLGAPAPGKGALAKCFMQGYSLTSNVLPEPKLCQEKSHGTNLGIEVNALTRLGTLVSDVTINRVAEQRLLLQFSDGFVFDGYPRTVGQAEALEPLLKKRAQALDLALLFDVPDCVLSQRMNARRVCKQCGQIVVVERHVIDANDPCPRCGGSLLQRILGDREIGGVFTAAMEALQR